MALPPILDRTAPIARPHMRRDSALDGKAPLALALGMSALDMKYFPSVTCTRSTTTTLNERQREILGSTKGHGLTAMRRESICEDVVKAETPCSSSTTPRANCVKKRTKAPPAPQSLLAPARTLSPVVGAVPFNHIHMPDYVFREALPALVLSRDIATWVTMYFKEPLAYHCYNYSQGMWLDFANKRPISRITLMHKARLLRMVNEFLGNFENADLELLIMGITTIFKVSTDDGSSSLNVPELFTPHADPEDLKRILKRMETVVLHAKALNRLLDQRGPDTPFKHFPGIEDSMPLIDVIISSAHATHPRYQNHSIELLTMCPSRVDPFPNLPSPYHEGLSFATSVPGTLPPRALAAYRNLATLDRVCATAPVPTAAHFKYFAIDPRVNAVQHQLLSVPHWHALPDEDQQDSCRVVYESCRIACILYSNSVIHPVPTAVGPWLPCLLADLKFLLQRSGIPGKGHEAVPLAVWVSFVGCMCSYGREDFGVFVGCLRGVCQVAGLDGWEAVRGVLEGFLWSERACGRGARVVWRKVREGWGGKEKGKGDGRKWW